VNPIEIQKGQEVVDNDYENRADNTCRELENVHALKKNKKKKLNK